MTTFVLVVIVTLSWSFVGAAPMTGTCPVPKVADGFDISKVMETSWYLYQRATTGKQMPQTDVPFCAILTFGRDPETEKYQTTTTFVRNGRKGQGVTQEFVVNKDGRLEAYDYVAYSYAHVVYLQPPYLLMQRCSQVRDKRSDVVYLLYTSDVEEVNKPLSAEQRKTFREIISQVGVKKMSPLVVPTGVNDCITVEQD